VTSWLPVFATALTVIVQVGALWLVRTRSESVSRADGAPSVWLVRVTSLLDIAGAAVLIGAANLFHWPLLTRVHLWKHDPSSAILIGSVGGFLLSFAGGGSPLSIAALLPARAAAHDRAADPAATSLFVLGEVGATFVWFGVALGVWLVVMPRLIALALVAAGFGLRRAAAGQDHPLLGALDAILLGLLAVFSGSLVAVLVARGTSDVLAYVRVAGELDEADAFAEGERPA